MSFKAQTQKNGKTVLKQPSSQQATRNFGPSSHQTHPAAIIQRVQLDPSSLTRQDVLHLQSTIGNRAVGRLLTQAPRNAGLADSRPVAQRQPEESVFGLPVQRQEGLEEEEDLQMKTNPAVLQRQEMEEEELLQGKFESVQRQRPEEEEEVIQGKFTPSETAAQLQGDIGEVENRTGMPDQLKTGLEQLSGMDLSGARVHGNSSKPGQLNALAYAQGQDIHVAPGQEKHLPHEGWHAVQQMQGRVKPTMQAKGVSINDDAGLEREADVMGAKALQPRQTEQSATSTASAGSRGLDQHSIGQAVAANLLQRKPIGGKMASANVSISPADQIIKDINTAYQGIFERQMLGLDRLETDIETPDRPSMLEVILGVVVSMAVSSAIGALGSIAQTKAKNVVKQGMTRKLVKNLEMADAHPLVIERVVGQVEDKLHEVAETRIESIRASAAGRAAAKMSDTAVEIALDKIFAVPKDKVPKWADNAIADEAMLEGLSAWKQTYFGTRLTLIKAKENAISGFNRALVSGLSMQELSAILIGMHKAKKRASKEQYISSLAAYSQLMTGPASERDLTPMFSGAARAALGMLVIEVEVRGGGYPIDAYRDLPKIKRARWLGLNQTVLKRVRSSFSNRKLRRLRAPVRIEVIAHKVGTRVRIPIEMFPGRKLPVIPPHGEAFRWLALYGKKFTRDPSQYSRETHAIWGAYQIWKKFRSHKLSELGL